MTAKILKGKWTTTTFALLVGPVTVIMFFSVVFLYSSYKEKLEENKIGSIQVSEILKRNTEPQACLTQADIKYVEENLNSIDQADTRLILYTGVKYMSPPSKLPYNLKRTNETLMKTHISKWVDKFFGSKRGGTFIECGGNNGETLSNTLYLERKLGWSGVLIECSPPLVQEIIQTHRKVWLSSVCLALGSTPATYKFDSSQKGKSVNGVIDTNQDFLKKRRQQRKSPEDTSFFEVKAVPLFTILASIGLKEVDFFSFDIEGHELAVLRSFPFEKVTFKVICVEVMYYVAYKPSELDELHSLMTRNNYTLAKKLAIDYIYVHKSVKHMIPKS